MTRDEFLAEVQTMLDMTDPLTPDTILAEIADYDSLAILNLMSLYDTIGVALEPDRIAEAVTGQDLIDLAGPALTDG